MRRRRLTIVFGWAMMFLGVQTAHGQIEEHQNEVYGGYGAFSTPWLAKLSSDIDNIFASLFTPYNPNAPRAVSTTSNWEPPLYLGYRRFVTPSWSVGGQFSYESWGSNTVYSDSTTGENRTIYKTISLRTDYFWMNRSYVKIYSGLDMGFSLGDHYNRVATDVRQYQKGEFAFGVNLIGFSVGKEVTYFMETGYGYTGMFKVGLSYRFPRVKLSKRAKQMNGDWNVRPPNAPW